MGLMCQFRPEDMEAAVQDVKRGESVRTSALQHNVSRVTLGRYLSRIKAAEGTGDIARKPGFHRPHGRVFSKEEEGTLESYLVQACDIYMGLSPKEVGLP